MADVSSVADAIEELGSWDGGDPNAVHDALTNLHRIVEATQAAYQKIGDKLADNKNLVSAGEAVHEAAGRLGGIATELEEAIAQGVAV